MDEERKYPDINKLYKEAYDTAYMEASLRAASPQKPVAWLLEGEAPFLIFPDEKLRRFKDYVGKPLYFATIPLQRTWVGLTYEEQRELYKKHDMDGWGHFYNAIEAKLRERNGC